MKNVQNNIFGTNSQVFVSQDDYDTDITNINNTLNLMNFQTYTFTTTFYKDLVPGPDDTVMTINFYKIGSLITAVVKRFFGSMNSVRYWASSTVLPVEYRPSFSAYGNFNSIIGPLDKDLDSDVISTVFIDLAGIVYIYKEADPGTGTFNGPNVGWRTFSFSYY